MALGRTGQHKTVFGVRRDPGLTDKNVLRDPGGPVFPFIGAEQYKGGWENSLKSGFGTLITDRSRYEGEFLLDKRDGLGTLWLRAGGEDGRWRKVYHGGWRGGKKHGEGTSFYTNGDVYQGEWSGGQRSGKGTMRYSNGDFFSGVYKDDLRNGPGELRYSSGDVFRGHFRDDKKDGPGLFLYRSTSKVYEGEWFEDQPRCGELRDPASGELDGSFTREEGSLLPSFEIPELELLRPQEVLADAVAAVRLLRSGSYEMRSVEPELFDAVSLERAKSMFSELDVGGRGLIQAEELQSVLYELRIQASDELLSEVLAELEIDAESVITFPDAIDIAGMIKRRELK